MVILPGIHGAGVFGMQGIGVSTPMAAVVAAATVGLAGHEHIPKVGTLTIGAWSMMLPAVTKFVLMGLGVGMSVLGAAPKLQRIGEPRRVWNGMRSGSSLIVIVRRTDLAGPTAARPAFCDRCGAECAMP
jgi:hypothetical protein